MAGGDEAAVAVADHERLVVVQRVQPRQASSAAAASIASARGIGGVRLLLARDDRRVAGAAAEIAGERVVDRLPRPAAASAVRVSANIDMTKPGVQKPHCEPWQSTIACCTGCSVPSAAFSPRR